MKIFLILLGVFLKQQFGLSAAYDRYVRRKEALWQPFLALAGFIGVGYLLLTFYLRLLNSLHNVSVQLNQPGMIVLLGFLLAQMIVLVFGLFYLISIFYFSHDLELLVPLPIPPQIILGAKLGLVVISEYLTVIPLTLPPLIIYGLKQEAGLLYWLLSPIIMLLLPLLPLGLAGIAIVLLMRFTRLAHRPDTVRVILMLIFFGITIAVSSISAFFDSRGVVPDEVARLLSGGPNSLLSIVGRRFPPALWGALALVEPGAKAGLNLAMFLLITALSLAGLWFVARHSFYQGLLGSGAVPKKKSRQASGPLEREMLISPRPVLAALVSREWLLIIRNPIFAMTAAQALIIPPLLLFIAVISGNSLAQLRQLAALPEFQLWGTLGFAGLVAINPIIASIPATAISREGMLFWISQVIPVAPRIQLLAKLVFTLVIAAVIGALMAVVLIPLGLPAKAAGIGLILGIIFAVPLAALSIAVDTLWPRLNWVSPQQAMKGNTNNLIVMALIAGLAYLLIRAALFMNKSGWDMSYIISAMGIIFLLLGVGAIAVMYRLAPLLYLQQSCGIGKGAETTAPARVRDGGKLRIRFSLWDLFYRYGRIILTGLTIIGLAIFLGREFIMGVTLEYEFGPDYVKFQNVVIPYEELVEVRLLEEVPPLSNRVGTSIGNYRSGTFTVEGIGRGRVVADDRTKPALVLFTNKGFYIITPDNAAERYKEIMEKTERMAE